MNGNERTFSEDIILVSKTDTKSIITYANENFINICGYTEKELLGKPHNIIRHPQMPAAIFKLLWENITQNKEVNAYVVNLCKNGDYYWVLANITPSIDLNGKIMAYHSTRRKPTAEALETVKPLYDELLQIEKRSGMEASYKRLLNIINKKGMNYDQFILSI